MKLPPKWINWLIGVARKDVMGKLWEQDRLQMLFPEYTKICKGHKMNREFSKAWKQPMAIWISIRLSRTWVYIKLCNIVPMKNYKKFSKFFYLEDIKTCYLRMKLSANRYVLHSRSSKDSCSSDWCEYLCGFAFKGTMLNMLDELDSDLTECPCIAVRGACTLDLGWSIRVK